MRKKCKDDEICNFAEKVQVRDYFYDNQYVIKNNEAFFVGSNHVYKVLLNEKEENNKYFPGESLWGKVGVKGKGHKERTMISDKQIMP